MTDFTPEQIAEFETTYFANPEPITLFEFYTDSYNQPAFRQIIVEGGKQDRAENGLTVEEEILGSVHMSMEHFGWHFGSHGGDPRLAAFETVNGVLTCVTHTRAEWNDLVMEALSHKTVERELLGAFGL